MGKVTGRKAQDGTVHDACPGQRLDDSDPHTPCGVYRVGKHESGRLLDGRTWDDLAAAAVPS